jgi:ATP-dependent DNA helicase RecG
MILQESQTVELKESWRDEYLKTVCAFGNTVSIWNDGELEKLSIEDLSREHDSYQRNPLIADIFYRAGYIEAWGRGTLMIIEETTKSGLSKPTFQIRQGGFEIIFQRKTSQLSDKKPDESELKLSLRQQKAVEYIRQHGNISNKIYQELNNVSKPTATRDLQKLVLLGIIEMTGTAGENIRYILMEQHGATVGS